MFPITYALTCCLLQRRYVGHDRVAQPLAHCGHFISHYTKGVQGVIYHILPALQGACMFVQ